MKRCPTCDKTFEDSMRFCQADGTPLVDDEPAFDPFATIVAPGRPKTAEPEKPVTTPAKDEAIEEPDDVLDIPEADPLKTMYVSDAEMRAALGTEGAPLPPEPEIVEIPPIEEPNISNQNEIPTVPTPEPPQFSIPEVPAPSFGDISPPPSPFSTGGNVEDRPMSAPSSMEPESSAPFAEAETVIQPSFPAPFDKPQPAGTPASEWAPPPTAPAPAAEWTPPAVDQTWQNQQVAGNQTFQPAIVDGQNKTLAIISLVCGIASLICCSWFLPGIAAIVLGFIARGKAKSSPAEYGGSGMALAGIITGAISLVMGVIVIILYLAGAMAGSIGNF